jgi:hypothetical protein
MPYSIGFVDNANGQSAHYNLLEAIRAFAVGNGWQVLRYVTDVENRELILKGSGYTGQEEIFVGFRTYQSESADYYNLLAGVFMGYAPGNPFDLQPGAALSGIPAHNQRIDYWLTINPQRIAGALKLGAPVYESFYVGKFLPYALPVQYPAPIACGGALNGAAATRFSDTTHQGPYHGGFLRIYDNAGWRGTSVSDRPLSRHNLVTVAALRDTGGAFPIAPVELYASNAGIFGMLEGVCYISGFNNIVENTLVIGGVTYVVIQNVWRTTVDSYYALALA